MDNKLSAATVEKYNQYLKKALEATIKLDGTQSLQQILIRLGKLKTKYDKPYSKGSVKIFLNAFQYLLRRKENPTDDMLNLMNELTKKINSMSTIENKEIAKNKLTEKQEKNFINWDIVLKVFNKVKNNKDLSKENFKDYLLLALYVKFNGPRRVKDYEYMFIAKDKTDLDDISKNWYVNNNKQAVFEFNQYKTSTKYGKQILKIPRLLNNIIQEYINKYNVVGSLLNMTDTAIKLRIKLLFDRYIDNKTISVNILRHSFINYISNNFTDDEKNGTAKRAMFAERMAHDVATQHDYFKNTDNITLPKVKYNKKTITKKGAKTIYNNDDDRHKAKLESQRKWRQQNK